MAVIIPCWNSGLFIRQMLNSIISQTFLDFKVYCVDDHSEDDTMAVIQEYAENDSRICVVSRDRLPKGAPTCRNIGFELSEGAEYVIWFDSDDVVAPFCLEQRVHFMDSHPELDFGCFKAKSFISEVTEDQKTTLYGYACPFSDDLTRFMRQCNPFGGWELIHRRSSLIKYQMSWDENLLSAQDTDFIIQLLLEKVNYGYAEESRIDYFRRTGFRPYSITLNNCKDANKVSDLYFLNKLHKSLKNEKKKEYLLELDGYLLSVVLKFYYDQSFIKILLQQEWLKNRNNFKYRVWLCSRLLCFMNKKFRYV